MSSRYIDSVSSISFAEMRVDSLWRNLSGILTGEFTSWIPGISGFSNPTGHHELLNHQLLACRDVQGVQLHAVLRHFDEQRRSMQIEITYSTVLQRWYEATAQRDGANSGTARLRLRVKRANDSLEMLREEERHFRSTIDNIKRFHESAKMESYGFD